MLLFSTALLALSAFNYGLSDQAFSSCQAMDSFIRQFGKYDASTHTWKIPALDTSLYNSIKAAGQIIGECSLLLDFLFDSTGDQLLMKPFDRSLPRWLCQQQMGTANVHFLDECLCSRECFGRS